MKLEAWCALALVLGGAGRVRGQEVLRQGTTEGRLLGGEDGEEQRYRGQWRELEGGVRVERLSFADPAAALRWAEQVMAPHEREVQGQVLVEVRGRWAVVLRDERDEPPLGLLAPRVLAQAWTGKAASAPRTWLGLRDARGLALMTARNGPLEEWTLATLDEARRRFPASSPPGEPGDRLRWHDEVRSAFSATTRDGRHLTLQPMDESTLVVQGPERTAAYLESELRQLLAGSPPARPGSPVRPPESIAPPEPETPGIAPTLPAEALRGLAGALGGM